jgi:hypothetical protein
MLAQSDLAGKVGQGPRAHKGSPQAGQSSFVLVREAVVEILANRKVEHGISEEFEPLVVGERIARFFVEVRSMGESALK